MDVMIQRGDICELIRRIFGVTTLDILRASTFVGEAKNVSPLKVDVPVIGGHSGATIIPVLSSLPYSFSEEELKAITTRIQFGGDEVFQMLLIN